MGIDPHVYFLSQYNEISMMLTLYYWPYWSDMTHQKPYLELLYLFMLKSILCLIFLISSPIFMFIPNISICIIYIMVFCYMYQSSLLLLGTSHNNLVYVQFMPSFSTQMVVLSVTVICKWNRTLYLYLQFLRCIFSI